MSKNIIESISCHEVLYPDRAIWHVDLASNPQASLGGSLEGLCAQWQAQGRLIIVLVLDCRN